MSRGLETATNTYLAGNSLLSSLLIEIGINGGTNKFYTDAPFDIDYSGNTYIAQGNFLGISEASEVSELQITNINLQISALDLTNVQTFAVSSQINQPVTIYRAFLDPTDNSLINYPIMIFKGRIGGYRVEDARETATITYEVVSQFANFDKKVGRRTNLGNFQQEFPQDFGMEYSHETLQDMKWGKK